MRSRFQKTLYACSLVAGIATLLLGVVVLVGWYTGNRTLIQVMPTFVPMQYNTALGFVLCGLSLTFAADGRNRPCTVFGGLATLVEDDPESRELMRRLLAKNGWEIAEAENLTQAERDRLNSGAERILGKGAYDKAEVLCDLRTRVSKRTGRSINKA